LLVDQQDAEQRIAELERQLAQQKRIAELERQLADARAGVEEADPASQVSAAQMDAIDEHARRLALALQGKGWQAGLSAGPEVVPLREALRRAVVDAGLSHEQYRDALARAGLRGGPTIKIGGQVVYQHWDPAGPVYLAAPVRGPYAAGAFGYGGQGGFSAPRRKLVGADRVGAILGVGGGGIGLCIGAAAAATAAIPSSALWMSAIVCDSGYQMAYNTSDYSYKPGQSGTTVSFQCVGDAGSYDVNDFAVFALQFLLIALVVFAVGAVVGLMWRRRRKPR
jgi:uncharacterized coiled-coil protein SlyX